MRPISSEQNPQYKTWELLLESRGVKKHGMCLVSGRKLVPEVLAAAKNQVEALIFPEDQIERERDFSSLVPAKHIFSLDKKLFKILDALGTHSPLLVIKLPELPDWPVDPESEGLELFLALGDPSNLGAVLRSAEAFGVKRVILLKEAASPFLPKAIRSAAGATFRVPLARGPSIQDLRGEFTVLDKTGTPLQEFIFPAKTRLLLGEEGQGIPESLQASAKLTIRMQGQIESLNAVVAASIVLFHASSRHR